MLTQPAAALLIALAIALWPRVATAQPPPGSFLAEEERKKAEAKPDGSPARRPVNNNAITLEAGGQIGYVTYGSFLRLGAGYNRYLSGSMWLDLGAGILLRKETDFVLNGGVRWKFGVKSGWRPFVRVGGELATLVRSARVQVVIAARGGGGAGYFSQGGAGLTLQAGVALGPAFGDGVRFAISTDIMLGAEIPF